MASSTADTFVHNSMALCIRCWSTEPKRDFGFMRVSHNSKGTYNISHDVKDLLNKGETPEGGQARGEVKGQSWWLSRRRRRSASGSRGVKGLDRERGEGPEVSVVADVIVAVALEVPVAVDLRWRSRGDRGNIVIHSEETNEGPISTPDWLLTVSKSVAIGRQPLSLNSSRIKRMQMRKHPIEWLYILTELASSGRQPKEVLIETIDPKSISGDRTILKTLVPKMVDQEVVFMEKMFYDKSFYDYDFTKRPHISIFTLVETDNIGQQLADS
ncbi:hypothetical protein Fmac_011795 [Flemingia macrophylla]|uniref:Uncharacterized protein n=1 Tax=Flemingia macrophylla TaxID=520843 RepID=A0ABD1MNF6_9FABA